MSTGQLVEQGTGHVFPLGLEPVTIGRDADNTIILGDPEVSRHHAEIAMQGGKWVIRDLGSANGTVVNGQSVGKPQELGPDDTIQVGQTVFRVVVSASITEQDTMEFPQMPSAQMPSRAGVPWMAVGLMAFAIVAAILVAVLVVLPRLRGDGDGDVARSAEAPSVRIASPADGARFRVGEPIPIEAQATDPQGVSQVRFLVDGVLVQQVPGATEQTTLQFNGMWTFEQAGVHTISVVARDAGGLRSAPVMVSVMIVGPAIAPTDTPVPPRPTATAIPTVPPPSPVPTTRVPPTVALPTVTSTPVPKPVIGFFRADRSTIERGQCARLEWGGVRHASRVILTDVGQVGSSGRLDVCLDATKIYTLRATGAGGTVQGVVRITVQAPTGPLVEYFRVIPSIIAPGDCAQLEWGKVENATSATINQGIGGVATPGSQEVCPDRTTTYVMAIEAPSGNTTAEVTLIVSGKSSQRPVIAFFTANPASIRAGECTTLSWGKVDYATEVTIDHGIGGVATPGSTEVCLGTETTYVMTAVGSGGSTEYSLTVAVSPGRLAYLPDLVVESILFEPNPCYRGQDCRVRIRVRNDGPVDAGSFTLRWAPAGEAEVPVEWDVDSVLAGQGRDLKYTWLPERADDSWTTLATVDVYDEVDEIEEGAANSLEQVITVLEP
jgi:hypothetical protein